MAKKILFGPVALELLGHDSVRITTTNAPSLYVYVDPYQLPTNEALPKADYLLITHTHQDHCSIPDIQQIIKPETTIITVPDALSKLSKLPVRAVQLLRPYDTETFENVVIETVPAYNIDKPFHPKENEWIGFIITLAGIKIYVAGDTDLIPEMKNFGPVHVAFLPVSGHYVMTAEEAAQAASILKPQLAIPMHYGSVAGTEKDAETFCSILAEKGIRTERLY